MHYRGRGRLHHATDTERIRGLAPQVGYTSQRRSWPSYWNPALSSTFALALLSGWHVALTRNTASWASHDPHSTRVASVMSPRPQASRAIRYPMLPPPLAPRWCRGERRQLSPRDADKLSPLLPLSLTKGRNASVSCTPRCEAQLGYRVTSVSCAHRSNTARASAGPTRRISSRFGVESFWNYHVPAGAWVRITVPIGVRSRWGNSCRARSRLDWCAARQTGDR